MKLITSLLKKASSNLYEDLLLKDYGLSVTVGTDNRMSVLRQIYLILKPIPQSLIRACGVKSLAIKSGMGPCKPFYPNHGYYIGNRIGINVNIFDAPDQPDDFMDNKGYFLTRAQQTLLHEFGHGYDFWHGELNLKPEWLRLSGWNKQPQPGLKRLIIKDTGTTPVVGEWFYSPQAEFTRFYAKRNPWDDWADCFSFYVAPLKGKVPPSKKDYFNNLLSKYYS